MSTAPTFLCIGVQKGGTTSLINYMNQHPQIYMRSGESHFFDNLTLSEKSVIHYESTFSPGSKTIIGEKTPSYCYLQYAIDRIHKYNPNLKLIILLREPVSRTYSQYNMNFPDKLDSFLSNILLDKNVNLHEITLNNPHGYNIVRGFYDQQLDYILSKFPQENVYIGISEEIQKNKNKEYNKIFKFLGAESEIVVDETVDCHILKYKTPIKKEDARALYDIYKPHNERLYEKLGRRIEIWEDYYAKLTE